MATEKATQLKDEAIAKGEETKKDVDTKVDESKKDSQPGYGDQAKAKADQAKAKAQESGQKVSSTITDGWNQAKGKFNEVNQYSDK